MGAIKLAKFLFEGGAGEQDEDSRDTFDPISITKQDNGKNLLTFTSSNKEEFHMELSPANLSLARSFVASVLPDLLGWRQMLNGPPEIETYQQQ
eukprot:GHVU01046737.1.p1 GENE.GHVU01046737.1~~GHVU01046737.1.p1  ORF type:complete len:101 (+),score=11.26 GHVU01046737.1:23-304(+)